MGFLPRILCFAPDIPIIIKSCNCSHLCSSKWRQWWSLHFNIVFGPAFTLILLHNVANTSTIEQCATEIYIVATEHKHYCSRARALTCLPPSQVHSKRKIIPKIATIQFRSVKSIPPQAKHTRTQLHIWLKRTLMRIKKTQRNLNENIKEMEMNISTQCLWS